MVIAKRPLLELDFGLVGAKQFEKRVKKVIIGLCWYFVRGQLFFTHHHSTNASGETGNDDETTDKQGADKLFTALKRYHP